MRLVAVEALHFGCIRSARVELGPGLNVLYGPNDLGKSTLARAIRAALLLPHTSRAARVFEPWGVDEAPRATVTFEAADRRIYRVEKRFGTGARGASLLSESNDGATFRVIKKAREVDDELRALLGWGIAGPATKGAPRGLPRSFLSTLLLGEQADVAGIFAQSLDADSHESGRDRLTSALEAFAQDPVFKAILEDAQRKVDEAYTPRGQPKRGRASPFREVSEDVKRVSRELEAMQRRVDASEGARQHLELCQEAASEAREASAAADEAWRALSARAERARVREGVVEELERARAAVQAHRAQLLALEEREARLADRTAELERMRAATSAAEEERSRAEALLREAEATLARAQGEDSARARQLEQAGLEKRALELEAEATECLAQRERLERAGVERATADASERRLAELEEADRAGAGALEAARGAAERAASELAELVVAGRVQELRGLRSQVAELEGVAAEVAADREAAAALRAEALDLAAGALDPELPSQRDLERLVELRHELDIAEARLGGGVAVAVERLRPVELAAQVDGAHAEVPDSGPVALDGNASVVLRVGKVALVRVTAGEREARLEAEAARLRWARRAVPVLEASGASDLDVLAERVAAAEAVRAGCAAAEAEAAGLQERAALRSERLEGLEELRQRAEALAAELGDARSAEALLDGLSVPLERRRDQARAEGERAREQVEHLGAERAAHEAERRVLVERRDSARARLDALGLEGHPDEARALDERAAAVAEARAEVAAALERLEHRARAAQQEAEGAVAAAREAVAEHEARRAQLEQQIATAQSEADRLTGELALRAEAVAQVDGAALSAAVAEVEARLPEDASPVAPAALEEAEERRAAAERALRHAEDEARKAEGALQTVGGQVVLEECRGLREALARAERRERDVELEYEAWRLLVEKLREAEDTEGVHLGAALARPVSQRFAALTQGRYGPVDLAPDLATGGLEVLGALRALDDLSVGTRDQLATLLRLTVAELLGSALVLDDQLAQTDPGRGSWFRALLRAHASNAQIVVLTCRPLDYVDAADLPAAGVSASRAAGLLHTIDLDRAILRADT